MRILISAPDLSPKKNVSGISSVVSTIIEGLSKNASFVHLKAGRSDTDSSGIKGYLSLAFSLVSFPWMVFSKKIDLFHQNVPLNAKGVLREFLFSTAARICRVPVLVHLHGGRFIDEIPSSKWLKKMTSKLLKNGCQVIVLNSYETDQLEKLYKVNSVILKNAVDTTRYSMKSLSKEEDLPVLLFLGRIHEEQGLNEMVEAFDLIGEKVPFKFILCGAGPQQDYFVQRFQKILGENFVFLGVVSGQLKMDVIQQSDFFLLPSYSEGLPIALLENMSCGVVPVVSDDEALLHVITDSVNGFVVKKKSSADLANKLFAILSLPREDIKRIALNVRESVERNYTLENYNNALLTIYQEIVH